MLKDNIKVGDYVRTGLGISKYIGKYVTGYGEQSDMYEFDRLDENLWSGDLPNIVYDCDINDIVIKSSSNIIGLIEVGDLLFVDVDNDYKGGIIVPRISETQNELDLMMGFIKNGSWILKGIVTREQMEAMEYKIDRQRSI